MNEKLIERKLRKGIQKQGGLALKFTSPSFSGVPDRIVLMPDGRLWFVELKTTGCVISLRQEVVFRMLQKLGFRVRIIDDALSLINFFQEVQK
jgi:hypothetical protein